MAHGITNVMATKRLKDDIIEIRGLILNPNKADAKHL
jgi:hypothetical protein